MLEEFFNPKAVAVIGASTSPDKLGYAVVENLVDGGYVDVGKIYPINPKADEILGQRAYPSVIDVPGDIDLAVIVIPYKYVPSVLEDCGKKKIPAVVIISAGFREAGMEGLERELELVEIADKYHIRIIGPNCLGIIDTFTPINASFSAGTPPKGPMAFMSQSGALGTAILDWAQAGRLGLAKFVSLGNKADVSEIDLLEYSFQNVPKLMLCAGHEFPGCGVNFDDFAGFYVFRHLNFQSGCQLRWFGAIGRTCAFQAGCRFNNFQRH